jgi:hypothetical protein
MSRIGVLAILVLGVPAGGCASFRALDQAAGDLASQAPPCTQQPAIGANNYGAKSCSVTFTLRSSTTTTVQEPGKAPVTTRTVTTPSGTTTEVVPTP